MNWILNNLGFKIEKKAGLKQKYCNSLSQKNEMPWVLKTLNFPVSYSVFFQVL